jgi:uncharacterized protein YkwD
VRVTMRSAYASLLAGLLALQTASPVAAARSDHEAIVKRVLELTNAERHTAGLTPLVLSQELNDAAHSYSQVLASSGCFAHTCGPEPNFGDRLGQAGYSGWTAIAENIAAGYSTPEAVVAGWMSSPGHRANILSPTYTEMGIGVARGGGRFGTYWTQEFGTRPGVKREAAPESAPIEEPSAPAEEPAPPATDQGESVPADSADHYGARVA